MWPYIVDAAFSDRTKCQSSTRLNLPKKDTIILHIKIAVLILLTFTGILHHGHFNKLLSVDITMKRIRLLVLLSHFSVSRISCLAFDFKFSCNPHMRF